MNLKCDNRCKQSRLLLGSHKFVLHLLKSLQTETISSDGFPLKSTGEMNLFLEQMQVVGLLRSRPLPLMLHVTVRLADGLLKSDVRFVRAQQQPSLCAGENVLNPIRTLCFLLLSYIEQDPSRLQLPSLNLVRYSPAMGWKSLLWRGVGFSMNNKVVQVPTYQGCMTARTSAVSTNSLSPELTSCANQNSTLELFVTRAQCSPSSPSNRRSNLKIVIPFDSRRGSGGGEPKVTRTHARHDRRGCD